MSEPPLHLSPGLIAWAALPGPAALLDVIRRRAERGFSTERGTVHIELSPDQRREVARLLGTPWGLAGKPVRLTDLTRALAEHGLTVRSFLEALNGEPLVDQRAQRAARRAETTRERSAAAALLTTIGLTEAHADIWLSDIALPRAGEGQLLALTEQLTRVWRALPGPNAPAVRLAGLAASVFGDAHALDFDSALGRAVPRLIALVHNLPRPLRAGRDWRRAWSAAGVLCDGVSSRVLVLNLPLQGTAPAARWCGTAAGEPLWLSLRSITGDWTIPAATKVFVCENPTVLEAAADTLGADCPPLVCTDGMPTIAALDLIAGIAEAGCELSVRADVDDAGFVIIDQVLTAAPAASLWRFDAATYTSCAELAPLADGDDSDDPPYAENLLRDLYTRHGIPLHEEALLDNLIGDLAAAATSQSPHP